MNKQLIPAALYSVLDKTGLVPLAQAIDGTGASHISTGGTGEALSGGGLTVIPIEEVTGNKTMIGGLVKTISHRISASVLHHRDEEKHVQAVLDYGMRYDISFVVCNLYDFWNQNDEDHIDIGGVLNFRQAAKSWRWVTIITDPSQYEEVIAEIAKYGKTSLTLRHRLAKTAFQATSRYDGSIAEWFESQEQTIEAEEEREASFG